MCSRLGQEVKVMNINPILMESGGPLQTPRSSWMRSAESIDSGTAKAVRDGTSINNKERQDSVDQLSQGLVGRVATPEWQGKIELAQGVQVADRAMAAIDERLQEAKRDLTKIHKMFPPYPHGSEERAEFLKSYKSLRMQIDKLTIPPENNTAAQILGGRDGGDNPPEVGQFPVNSGDDGLGLLQPGNPIGDLEDDELPGIIEDLERASGIIGEHRKNLEKSAVKVLNVETGADAAFVEISNKVKEKLAASDFSISRSTTGVHQDLPFLG